MRLTAEEIELAKSATWFKDDSWGARANDGTIRL